MYVIISFTYVFNETLGEISVIPKINTPLGPYHKKEKAEEIANKLREESKDSDDNTFYLVKELDWTTSDCAILNLQSS